MNTAESSAAAQSRSRAIRLGAQLGVGARVVSVGCTLLQVPLALHLLGAEGFGLWMTLTNAAGILTLGDFGVGLSARTVLAEAAARGQPGAVRTLAARALGRLALIGIAVALLGSVLAWSVDWATVLHVTSPELRRQLPYALTALAILSGLAIPATLGAALAAAFQLTWLLHLGVAIGGAATLALVAAAAWGQASWLTLVLGALALPVLFNIVIGLCVMRRELRHLPANVAIDASEAQRLTALGRWFFVNQAGAFFMVMGLPLLIAGIAGPIAAAAFNLLQRLFNLVSQTHWMTLSAFWPAYSDARAHGDHAWIRRAHAQSWRLTWLVFVPAMALLAVVSRTLIAWWVEAPPSLNLPLLVSVAGWFALQLLGQPPALLLNGLGAIRRATLFALAGHAISLIAALVGGRLAGAPGVVGGMILGYALIGLPLTLRESRRELEALR